MSRPGEVVKLIAALALVPACVRDAEPALCPDVVAGDLVITELRGAQTGSDTYGQWVELYNASGTDLDLRGLHVDFLRIDGGARARVIVRRSLPLAAGGYVVLGRAADDDRTLVMDYGMGTDFASSWFASAGVTVSACDVTVDMSHGRFAPVARYDCAGTVRFTDMAGRDMTDLVGSG